MTNEELRIINDKFYRQNYVHCLEVYHKLLDNAIAITGDIKDEMDIRIESVEDYVKRQSFYVKFTAWSKKYVYVIEMYDGWKEVISIPRDPSDEIVEPIGGG